MSRANYRNTILTKAEESEGERQAKEQHERVVAEKPKKKDSGMNPMAMMQGMMGGGE